MIRLSDLLAPDDLRRLNLDLLFDPDEPYLRGGPFGDLSMRQVEQNVRNVPSRRLRRIIDAVEPFDDAQMPQAWSHFMACHAGTHPFPDANHRTAMLAFSLATRQAFGQFVGLSQGDALALGRGSKRLRDPARVAKHRVSFYTIEELSDPGHPYRRFFAAFEPRLVVVDVQRA